MRQRPLLSAVPPGVLLLVLALNAGQAPVLATPVSQPDASNPQKPGLQPTPAVSVLELGNGTTLNFPDVADPSIRIPLSLWNSTTEDVSVTPHSTPFLTANGESIQPVFCDSKMIGEGVCDATHQPLSFTATHQQPQVIFLVAVLPTASTYHATVRLEGGHPPLAPFLVTVIRTGSPAQFEVVSGPPALLTQGLARPPKQVNRSLELPTFTLYARSHSLTLDPPTLLYCEYRNKPDATTPIAVSAELLSQAGETQLEAIVVKDGQRVRRGYRLLPEPVGETIGGSPDPGRYDAGIRFSANGYSPVDKTVTIYLRRPCWHAGLFIFLGVALSWGVGRISSWVLPRLSLEKELAWLDKQFASKLAQAMPNSPTAQLIGIVRQSLIRTLADLRQSRREVAADIKAYKVIDAALPAWEALDGVRASLPEKEGAAVQQRLDAARRAFEAYPPVQETVQAAASGLDTARPIAPQAFARLPADVLALDRRALKERLEMDPEAIEKEMRRIAFITSVAVAAVAVIVGIQVLWSGNYTWGAPGSYAAAFGLGFASDLLSKAGVMKLWTLSQQ